MMDREIEELIEGARQVCETFSLVDEFSAGSVGASIKTNSGRIYTGICIDLGCGLGFCAETAAMAEMLKERETQIQMMVAVSDTHILPPCGRCREMALQIDQRNIHCKVVLPGKRVVELGDLLPENWLSTQTKVDSEQD